jgi:ligand-binding SRPBCC domain-containing protein
MTFVKESMLEATPEAVFAFHEDPDALERLTPPWEPVEVVESSGSIGPGSRVVLRMRVGPFPVHWLAVHTEYDPPHLFVDEQESGPFARWTHRHRFLATGNGRTRLRDEIEFEPPLGWIGRALLGGFLRRKLERTFAYRHEVTRRAVESRPV